MEAGNVHKTTMIGKSEVLLFKLEDCFKVIAENLEKGKRGIPPCSACPIRPYKSSHGVPSDWDDEKDCLKPDSGAWNY
jgi:hypothetical protein